MGSVDSSPEAVPIGASPLQSAVGMHQDRVGKCTVEKPMALPHLADLPHVWVFFLDPASLLRVLTVRIRAAASVEEEAWHRLSALEVGVPLHRLHLSGPVTTSSRVACWRRFFYDLDVVTLRNRIRCSSDDYSFFPDTVGDPAKTPEEIAFLPDERGVITRCQLMDKFGRDRCVVAAAPLPGLLATTVLPKKIVGPGTVGEDADEFDWHGAYRPVGYYEVTLEHTSNSQFTALPIPSGHVPCVSIGLCNPGLPRHSSLSQQAGWNEESWALHSDDGCLYHGSGTGRPFEWAVLDHVQRNETSPRVRSTERQPLLFSEGDTVGCGIFHHVPPAQTPKPSHDVEELAGSPLKGLGISGSINGVKDFRKQERWIFFTLNGRFLGFTFKLDNMPANVPLWPCVGLDAPWTLAFNFGHKPFQFDLEAAMPPLEVRLTMPFESAERKWSRHLTLRQFPAYERRLSKASSSRTFRSLHVSCRRQRRILPLPRPVFQFDAGQESDGHSSASADREETAAPAQDWASLTPHNSSRQRSFIYPNSVAGTVASLQPSAPALPSMSQLGGVANMTRTIQFVDELRSNGRPRPPRDSEWDPPMAPPSAAILRIAPRTNSHARFHDETGDHFQNDSGSRSSFTQDLTESGATEDGTIDAQLSEHALPHPAGRVTPPLRSTSENSLAHCDSSDNQSRTRNVSSEHDDSSGESAPHFTDSFSDQSSLLSSTNSSDDEECSPTVGPTTCGTCSFGPRRGSRPMPLTSKFLGRELLGDWVSWPMRKVVDRYSYHSRAAWTALPTNLFAAARPQMLIGEHWDRHPGMPGDYFNGNRDLASPFLRPLA